MASKKHFRGMKKARKSEFIVQKVPASVWFSRFVQFVSASVFLAAGCRALVTAHSLIGVILLLCGLFFVRSIFDWRTEKTEEVVLAFTESGLKYRERFIAWDDISGIEFEQRFRSADSISLRLTSNDRINVSGEHLDHLASDIADQIQRRTGCELRESYY